VKRSSRCLVAAGVALSVAAVLAACGGDDDASTADSGDTQEQDGPTVGHMTEPATAIGKVSLPDLGADGAAFPLRAAPGKLLLVFFGFSNCPDICPGTMANVKFALGRLGDRAADVDVAMVTVDPERDLEVLPEYVQAYVPTAHALGTDDPVALQKAADAFGVTYTVQDLPGGESEVGHTSALYGVDDTGALVITWLFGITATDLANDLTYLLDQHP
jgi:protein SCO1/2